LAQLHDAHRQVDALLRAIDSGLLGPPAGKDGHASDPPDAGIEAWLARRTAEPLTGIVDELRAHLAPEALRLVPDPVPDTVGVAVTDDPGPEAPYRPLASRPGSTSPTRTCSSPTRP
jgi:hypothetical protein